MANYTQIENLILEFLYSANLSASELQILLFLIRYSKGFHRSTTKASYSYISKGTGLSIATSKRAILKFLKMGIISEEYSPNGSSERVVRIEWSKLNALVVNPERSCGQIRYHIRIKTDHQEIKEEIKDKKEKNKKETSSQISLPKEREKTWEELNEEDFDD